MRTLQITLFIALGTIISYALLFFSLAKTGERVIEFPTLSSETVQSSTLINDSDSQYQWMLCSSDENAELLLFLNNEQELSASSNALTSKNSSPRCIASAQRTLLPAGTHEFTHPPDSELWIGLVEKPAPLHTILCLALLIIVLCTGIWRLNKSGSEQAQISKFKWHDALLAFIISLAIGFAFGQFWYALGDTKVQSWNWQTALHAMSVFSFIALALIFAKLRHPNALLSLGLGAKSKLPLRYAVSAGVTLAVIAMIGLILFAPEQDINQLNFAHSLPGSLSVVAFYALIAPFSEELFFRGFLQEAFCRAASKNNENDDVGCARALAAILITSMLFLSLHLAQAAQNVFALVPIALMSLLSGVLRYRSKSLHASVVLHLSYNATLITPMLISQL
ncbi:MAG: type II CAAX endopeptidase family protein [Bradymonadales bacterium]|jgi:membrane protease YdiL (CAAX protease family)